MEIGFGNGEFLARNSVLAPERDFVGLELSWNSIKRALRRINRPPRSNVKLIRIPGRLALERLFAPNSLEVIRCLFPVPWPNPKMANKRLFSTTFLDLVANRLIGQGFFQMVTDNRELADWTNEQATISALELEMVESQAKFDTKYERKWQDGGREIFFHFIGRKRFHKEIPALDSCCMQTFFSDRIDPFDYSPPNFLGQPTVVFGQFIYDSRIGQGLIRTKVVESNFAQEFYIKLSEVSQGRFQISPALPRQIFPTDGVNLALSLASLNEVPK